MSDHESEDPLDERMLAGLLLSRESRSAWASGAAHREPHR